jgi:demethylmenaquinone methyltransferase/2-methoxy-6-polyprenyl-1,4-benzoquinol methylase
MKRTYFDNLAQQWDSLPAPPNASARITRFIEAAVTGSERSVLDVGSGTGILLPSLRERIPAARVYECDFAAAMLLVARQKCGNGNVSHVCADAAAPPFAPGAFDLVLCFNVIPHLPSIEGSLRALLGCLCAGGRLAVGHGMGSGPLNALHSQIGGPVGADVLPSPAETAAMLVRAGAFVLAAEESPEHYLVIAQQ